MIKNIYNKQTLTLVGKPYITTDEEFKENPARFFPDWNPDLHIATDTEYTNPVLTEEGFLREKTREEFCKEGDLSILTEGEVYEDGKITYLPRPIEMLKPIWNYPKWEETATENELSLHSAQTQYNDYLSMNNPIAIKQMEAENIHEEYFTMMNELQSIILQLSGKVTTYTRSSVFSLPTPSEELKKFKELYSYFNK